MPEHGGKIHRVAAATGTRPEDWLDLSTGISPYPWPVPEIPANCWQRLPEEEDGLVETALDYYGAPAVLPVAGETAAILALPRLRPNCRVAVVSPTYAEHAHSWRQAGHRVEEIPASELARRITDFQVVVVVNPNNPTGTYFPGEILLDWHAKLAAHGCWLVIDEAFIDPTPDYSLTSQANRKGLIVLRSFGKFFGCAGVRLGFVIAAAPLLEAMRALLGPWHVNAPARRIGKSALRDRKFHGEARETLLGASAELRDLLRRYGLGPSGGTPFFQWVKTDRATRIAAHFQQHRILLRRFSTPESLRFGLPGTPQDWHRLRTALETLREKA
ncbi:MAG TPA: threonine-phosphate decarboxylase CobD [Methylococcus sp.]|nr:threonine-phosphate decarboxylase CobD [Methylococcus sp.]